jgi:hypothetical protein
LPASAGLRLVERSSASYGEISRQDRLRGAPAFAPAGPQPPYEVPGVETPALSSCIVDDDDAIVVVVDRRSQPMAQITINEGLAWLKTLKKRHEELLALRNDNAHRERRFYGASADKEIVKEPVYDVKVLDKLVTRIAREIRLLDQALKATNARTVVERYEQDDTVLGELT